MAYDFSGVSIAWAAAALVVALCWPISQALRHERLRPIAAFLLFTSAFILVAAISSACEGAGCQVGRFISALGPYGTWVIEIERAGEDQRIVWNGKEERLVLQVKLRQGGWEDLPSIAVAAQDTDGFVAAVTEILS